MKSNNCIAYYRVSTARQGESGLGLEAQKHAVAEYLDGGGFRLRGEFLEVESGRVSDRPQLTAALAACRYHRATLVIAKLDRLARDAHFLLGLDKAGVEFVAVDMPTANRLTIGILALVAEEEARAISQRTKVALAVAKSRGVKLGTPRNLSNAALGNRKSAEARSQKSLAFAKDLAPILRGLQRSGIQEPSRLAQALNRSSVPAPKGGRWRAIQVMRLLNRLANLSLVG